MPTETGIFLPFAACLPANGTVGFFRSAAFLAPSFAVARRVGTLLHCYLCCSLLSLLYHYHASSSLLLLLPLPWRRIYSSCSLGLVGGIHGMGGGTACYMPRYLPRRFIYHSFPTPVLLPRAVRTTMRRVAAGGSPMVRRCSAPARRLRVRMATSDLAALALAALPADALLLRWVWCAFCARLYLALPSRHVLGMAAALRVRCCGRLRCCGEERMFLDIASLPNQPCMGLNERDLRPAS